jgi:hypothetical protein
VVWGFSRGAQPAAFLTSIAFAGAVLIDWSEPRSMGRNLPAVATLYPLGCTVGGRVRAGSADEVLKVPPL